MREMIWNASLGSESLIADQQVFQFDQQTGAVTSESSTTSVKVGILAVLGCWVVWL